jgi:hypothetical protein
MPAMAMSNNSFGVSCKRRDGKYEARPGAWYQEAVIILLIVNSYRTQRVPM